MNKTQQFTAIISGEGDGYISLCPELDADANYPDIFIRKPLPHSVQNLEPKIQIYLLTVAASLDMRAARRKHGRTVRAALLVGEGNNGKDSLRECERMLYNSALTGRTFTDFKSYDRGRKFTLSILMRSRLNHATENTEFVSLDSLQCLKAAITGDTLSYERKGKDEVEFEPQCPFFFNVNRLPTIQGSLESVSSRYGIIELRKYTRSIQIRARENSKPIYVLFV